MDPYSWVMVWAAPQAIENTRKISWATINRVFCPKMSVNFEKRRRNPELAINQMSKKKESFFWWVHGSPLYVSK